MKGPPDRRRVAPQRLGVASQPQLRSGECHRVFGAEDSARRSKSSGHRDLLIVDQVIRPNGREVELIRLELRRWRGEFSGTTWGRKPLVDVGGEPVFAEIAVLQLMRSQGWDGCWCSSKYLGAMPPSTSIALPAEQDRLLARIRSVAGR